MPTPDIPERDDLVRPFERVLFANGLEATLQDDGTLRIMATARGLRGITIYPSSDNSCLIGVIGKMYRANAKTEHLPPSAGFTIGTKDKTAREITLEAALEDANGMCRSAMAIAERNGEANWPAFTDRLRESLERQHAVMYPRPNAQALAQPGRNKTPTP